VYLYPANPIGLLLAWHVIIYVGETNSPAHRRRQHMRGSWWRWLTWGVPIVVPVFTRRVGLVVEEGIVRLLRTPGNREYNRGGLRPTTVALRLLVAVVVGCAAWRLGLTLPCWRA
jgi:hypothetical protein